MTSSLVLPIELIQMIQDGDFDNSFESIKAAIRQREKLISRMSAITMRAGDQFAIKDVSPKYLNGAWVEFVEYTSGVAPVRVKFVYSVRGYYAGRILNLRESHIGVRR